MECLVTLPDTNIIRLVSIVVNPKGKGQECMDELCKKLDIIEQDYFGITYKGRCNETLYLNLRNRLDRQLLGQPPHRLQFRVKFYVQPHYLQQITTRTQFYDQVRQDFETQKLVFESEEQAVQTVALMVQADCGNYERQNHQLNLYKKLYTNLTDQEPSSHVIQSIIERHIQLGDLSRDSAQYQVLQVASELPGYGIEYFEAMCGAEATQVGIGPSGMMLYTSNTDITERLMYPVISKAEHVGKCCVVKVLNDNGTEREMTLRLQTHNCANSLYRAITEMHSFYCCDTVHSEVSSQFCRDLKGTLASLFNEKTTLGRDYVFDIKRTLRETVDHTRRMLFKTTQMSDRSEDEGASDPDLSDGETTSAKDRSQVLVDTISRIQESFTCCVCRDSELSAALIPCGHLTCLECAEKLTECPLCRKNISARQRIFFPAIHPDDTSCASSSSSSISLKTVTHTKHRHRHKRKRGADMDVLASES